MTGCSAVMDETGTAFSCPRPGRLADVFGIRVAGFYRTDLPDTAFLENLKEGQEEQESLKVVKGEEAFRIDVNYYEELELREAVSYAVFEGKELCAISENQYGKGKAYYIVTEPNTEILDWLIHNIAEEIGLAKGLEMPEGICARKIGLKEYFYLNKTSKTISVPLLHEGKGVLTDRYYEKVLKLAPYDGELIVTA
jgi:beta-galactosidase